MAAAAIRAYAATCAGSEGPDPATNIARCCRPPCLTCRTGRACRCCSRDEIGTRSEGGGLVASAIWSAPSPIAPDPVAVALGSGGLLADGRTVRVRVVVEGQRRLSERRSSEQRESRCQDHLLHDVKFFLFGRLTDRLGAGPSLAFRGHMFAPPCQKAEARTEHHVTASAARAPDKASPALEACQAVA